MTLSVKDLRVYYRTLAGEVKALDGATFELADGEIMGLAGESGCGKSTLGKSLIRLGSRMKYIDGMVELDGEEMPVWDDERMDEFRFKRVSIVPQYSMSAMNPTRRIGKMIRELLGSRGVDYGVMEDELRRRLKLVGLSEDVLGMYPIELSGGMKQRMVMVLSTLLDPSLLIADEVTSALDVSSQRAVAQMLVEFRDLGLVKSMIVITHDVAILYQIADSILIMYAGMMAEKAPTETALHAPLHPYTKMLVSSLPEVGARYVDEPLTGITGRPPKLLDPPVGCRFRDRCPVAFDKCYEEPPFKEIAENHFVACWKVFDDVEA